MPVRGGSEAVRVPIPAGGETVRMVSPAREIVEGKGLRTTKALSFAPFNKVPP
jgi:hypothetical protein